MGKTFKHKNIAKSKINNYQELDMTTKKIFDGHNWDLGESKKNKKIKIDKILYKQFKKDLDYNDEI